MGKKNVYALSSDELDKELVALKACWDALKGVDSNSRKRIVSWIEKWTYSESSDGSDF